MNLQVESFLDSVKQGSLNLLQGENIVLNNKICEMLGVKQNFNIHDLRADKVKTERDKLVVALTLLRKLTGFNTPQMSMEGAQAFLKFHKMF